MVQERASAVLSQEVVHQEDSDDVPSEMQHLKMHSRKWPTAESEATTPE